MREHLFTEEEERWRKGREKYLEEQVDYLYRTRRILYEMVDWSKYPEAGEHRWLWLEEQMYERKASESS